MVVRFHQMKHQSSLRSNNWFEYWFSDRRANVQGKDIFMYAATKQKFATSGSMKKTNFKAAIDQIESALKGDDPAPNSYEVILLRHIIFGVYCCETDLFFRLQSTDSAGQVECNLRQHT